MGPQTTFGASLTSSARMIEINATRHVSADRACAQYTGVRANENLRASEGRHVNAHDVTAWRAQILVERMFYNLRCLALSSGDPLHTYDPSRGYRDAH